MIANWYLMLLRSTAGVAATYMGGYLIIAFLKNHYEHKPKRWLVGWQGLLFLGVGLDQLWRAGTRANYIFYGEVQDVTSWPYLLFGTMIAVGAVGSLITWIRWPSSRTTGAHDLKYHDKEA